MSNFKMVSINQQIEKLRKTMLDLVAKHGFSHPDVIRCSQELDQFIYKVQKNASKQTG